MKSMIMDLYNEIDFCIITKPYDDAVDYIIFLTRRGDSELDITLLKETEYGDVAKEMTELGFYEMEEGLTFEVTENVLNGKYTQKKIKRLLESKGMKYSFPLEESIARQFEMLKIEARAKIQDAMADIYEKQELYCHEDDEELERINNLNSNFTPINQTPMFGKQEPKHPLPDIEDKVTLSLYLYLQCAFTAADNAVLELSGGFDSKQNKPEKNFIKIIEADFARKESENPGAVRLECTKTFVDLLKEVDVLFSGEFSYKKATRNEEGQLVMRNKSYKYNIFDIVNSIGPLFRITLEIDESDYDKMIDRSIKIKEEKERTFARELPYTSIAKELEQLVNRLDEKRVDYAEDEEFEKAGRYKNYLESCEKMLDMAKSNKGKMTTTEEYFKNFSLPIE